MPEKRQAGQTNILMPEKSRPPGTPNKFEVGIRNQTMQSGEKELGDDQDSGFTEGS